MSAGQLQQNFRTNLISFLNVETFPIRITRELIVIVPGFSNYNPDPQLSDKDIFQSALWLLRT